MTQRPPSTEVVTCQGLAQIWGWNRKRAWRYLRELELQHGSTVILRRGRSLFTTRTQLAKIGVTLPAPVDPRVDRRLAALEQGAVEQVKRTDALAREVGEFRRKSSEWLKRRS